ncbi:hypothetical protein [Shimia sp. MMG029]|uniref:hypothetical protein n=1 Tax=Shimia sp. MMG029 TaxID=3021978 RepID=UPI0022FE7A2F|nr:hypothetical protein [Shimia sp. MMG029]MDA5558687.1 hypothetical protein [Shimia sp. MMG029]
MDETPALNQVRRLRKIRTSLLGVTFLLFVAFLAGKHLLYTDEKEIRLGDWFSIVSISVFSACAIFGIWVNNRAARLK